MSVEFHFISALAALYYENLARNCNIVGLGSKQFSSAFSSSRSHSVIALEWKTLLKLQSA